MTGALVARWRRLSTRAKVVLLSIAVLLVVAAAVVYMWTGDGIVPVAADDAELFSYLSVFVLIALDAVMPIFPGETTLNAAATLAAQGELELLPIIVMGALGAIVGDSCLFWIARRNAKRLESQLDRAKGNARVQQAFDVMNSSPGALIIGGRYLPGMRFVVNASMGLSDIAYRRFLGWSVISGILWSTYTSVLAYKIGVALGEYPIASFAISGLVGSIAIAAVFIAVRRSRRRSAAESAARATEH